ncbi:MAG: caspase family protein [Planctomycetota bacterium]
MKRYFCSAILVVACGLTGLLNVSPVSAQDRVERGVLDASDTTLDSGEYADIYDFHGVAGQQVLIDLRSTEFDPYLMFVMPDDEQLENDDFEGSETRSVITAVLPATGSYQIYVTSYEAGLIGNYAMQVTTVNSDGRTMNVAPQPVRTERGRLQPGDATLTSGEYVDSYPFQGARGDKVSIRMQSSEFDPYLIFKLPNGEQLDNDDFQGDASRSLISITLPETGAYEIMATSYEPNLVGNYVVEVAHMVAQGQGGAMVPEPGGVAPAPGGVAPPPGGVAPGPGGAPRVERGQLVPGDETLTSGEYVDRYDFQGVQGELVTIDMRSSEFDPYLIFTFPDGEQEDNDDFEGDATRSVISMTLPQTGAYQILATSYQPNLTGNYSVEISRGGASVAQNSVRNEVGSLAQGDATLRSGEFRDTYTFTGYPGQRVNLDVFSSQFDTYLVLRAPSGEQYENDDAENAPGHSIVDMNLNESGTWEVWVTSYQPGESGNYELSMSFGESNNTLDVEPIAINQRLMGALSNNDSQLPEGEFNDVYVFDGTEGQLVKVRLESGEFDTYLGLVVPSGESIENDDFEGDTRASQVAIRLPETGRYRIVTTSYSAGETGDYRLALTEANENEIASNTTPNGGGRIYGIFVGISDYGGRIGDLQWTATDAALIRDAFVTGCGMGVTDGIILTDAVATSAEFRNALAEIESKITPNDTFVFFFSGHGGQYQRNDRPANDVDGMDESLEFRDTEILDDELAAMLDRINSGTQLIVIDSCFSGGFAKDVISRPGRMGLFSSQEGMVSMEASKFRAGGYLAKFFADAIKNGIADTSADGALSPNEIEDYIRRMYNEEAISSSRDIGYQRLRVDSGSINPTAPILFVR